MTVTAPSGSSRQSSLSDPEAVTTSVLPFGAKKMRLASLTSMGLATRRPSALKRTTWSAPGDSFFMATATIPLWTARLFGSLPYGVMSIVRSNPGAVGTLMSMTSIPWRSTLPTNRRLLSASYPGGEAGVLLLNIPPRYVPATDKVIEFEPNSRLTGSKAAAGSAAASRSAAGKARAAEGTRFGCLSSMMTPHLNENTIPGRNPLGNVCLEGGRSPSRPQLNGGRSLGSESPLLS